MEPSPQVLQFYFDFTDPFSFIAFRRISNAIKGKDIELNFHPILLYPQTQSTQKTKHSKPPKLTTTPSYQSSLFPPNQTLSKPMDTLEDESPPTVLSPSISFSEFVSDHFTCQKTSKFEFFEIYFQNLCDLTNENDNIHWNNKAQLANSIHAHKMVYKFKDPELQKKFQITPSFVHNVVDRFFEIQFCKGDSLGILNNLIDACLSVWDSGPKSKARKRLRKEFSAFLFNYLSSYGDISNIKSFSDPVIRKVGDFGFPMLLLQDPPERIHGLLRLDALLDRFVGISESR